MGQGLVDELIASLRVGRPPKEVTRSGKAGAKRRYQCAWSIHFDFLLDGPLALGA